MMATLSATSAPSIAAAANQSSSYHHSRSSSAPSSPLSSPTHSNAPSPSSSSHPPSTSSRSKSPPRPSSSTSPSPSSFPSSPTSFPPSWEWNGHLPDIYGGARKGAKPYQEDAFCTFISPSRLVYIGGVFDGHGGYNGLVASCTARDFAFSTFQRNSAVMEEWSVD